MEYYNKYKFTQENDTIAVSLNGTYIIKFDTISERFYPGFAGNDNEKTLLNAYLGGKKAQQRANSLEAEPYYIWIMTENAIHNGIINRNELDDDEVWARAEQLYEEFKNSKYNNEDNSEYDCIVEFCSNYQKIHYELWDNRTNKMLHNHTKLDEIELFLLSIKTITDREEANIMIAIDSENMSLLHENIKHLGYKVLKINN